MCSGAPHGAICNAARAQVSVGEVLYWGLELKAVTTPYLANLDASRPEVMVKDMAMLHC